MGKIRGLFKTVKDTKGTFHAKIGKKKKIIIIRTEMVWT